MEEQQGEQPPEPMLQWHLGRWQGELALSEGGVVLVAMSSETLQCHVTAYLNETGGTREAAMTAVRRLSYWLNDARHARDEAVRIQRFGRPPGKEQGSVDTHYKRRHTDH